MKNLIILPLLAIFLVACEKSTLKITHPEDSFFLNKLKTLNGFEASGGGETITIGSDKYKFEKKITGLAGIYQKEGSDEYMFVLPAGNEAHTVTVNAEEKKALEEIINIVGEENSGSIIQDILSKEEKLDAESISKSFPDKKDAIENVIDNLYTSGNNNNKDSFGSYKKYT